MKFEIEIPDGWEQCSGPVNGGAILWADGSIEPILRIDEKGRPMLKDKFGDAAIAQEWWHKYIWLRPTVTPVGKAIKAIEEAIDTIGRLPSDAGPVQSAYRLFDEYWPAIKKALEVSHETP